MTEVREESIRELVAELESKYPVRVLGSGGELHVQMPAGFLVEKVQECFSLIKELATYGPEAVRFLIEREQAARKS